MNNNIIVISIMNKMSINNIGRKWVIGRSLPTIEKNIIYLILLKTINNVI